ncbi:MAG: methyltransferase domain-containing protein [Mariprofundales bacterium]|nr:methyltransferase domain-containing protein [Mariprofundales bacterium]
MPSLRVRYQTLEFGLTDIHLRTLRNNQEFSDDEGVAEKLGISSATWPLFGIVWPSGQVLAHLMFDYEIAGKRILEVGCGIALSSLVLNHRQADITATDYHPEAANFLRENTALNHDAAIPFFRTGWGDPDVGLGKFDLIIGSDLLYERGHAELLSTFIDNHTKPHCEVILIDPGRGHHARFSKRMVSLGYLHRQTRPENTDYLDKPLPKGQVLHYQRS